MVDLGTLSGDNFSFPIAVNDSGQVVGYSGNFGNSEYRPFSWTLAGGIVELESLGGNYSSAIAVNAKGQVAGSSQTTGSAETHAVFWSTSQQDPVSLILAVKNLLASVALGSGNANSLITKVEGAIQQLDDGNIGPAVNKLEAFINEVEALVRSRKLTTEEGQLLTDEARRIIDALT